MLLLVSAVVVERVSSRGRILSGVEVAGADVSGQTTADARRELADRAVELQTEPITARAGNVELILDPTTIDYQVDVDATVARARAQGRSRNPINQLTGVVARRLRDDVVPLAATWNHDRLDEAIDAWSSQLSDGLENGGLRFEGTTVIEIEPRAGNGLRRDQAADDVDAVLHRADRPTIKLSVGPTDPAVDVDEVHRAAEQARTLIADPPTLQVASTQIALTPEQIASTLTVTPRGRRLVLGVDPARLRAEIGDQLAPFEMAPVDAHWDVDGTSATVIPAVVGRRVDLEAAGDRIIAGDDPVMTSLEEIRPARTTKWAENLHITELVSGFTTYYPSGQERVKNIHRAADIVNNSVVEPGETFSLNDTLGPRTVEAGFVKAPAFSSDDGFFEDYGGGVSQFSTTLFNATFFSGYEDVEHTPHSIYISRYPMGREATLNYRSIDNRFRNDSDCGVLIRASYSATSVSVSYYGCKDREVEAEGPNILEEIPPTEETEESPFLAPGDKLQISAESGYTGYKVENFRTIRRAGTPEVRERFYWEYDMRPKKVYVGPPDPTISVLPDATPPSS